MVEYSFVLFLYSNVNLENVDSSGGKCKGGGLGGGHMTSISFHFSFSKGNAFASGMKFMSKWYILNVS